VRSLQGERAYWDETAELLASLIDSLERQTFYLRKAHFTDAGDPPVALPRPGETHAGPKTVSLAQWAGSL
jgi:hypothetical protein